MKLRILFGIIVLLVIPALIAAFVIVRFMPIGEGDSNVSPVLASSNFDVAPRPPAHAPIVGDRVTLEEAQRRTPYTIPVPPAGVVGADIQEVWVSRENRPDEFKQVYIKYSNGLDISIGGEPTAMDYGELMTDPFREVGVRGMTAKGKDPFVKTTGLGTQANIPGSLSWWVNRVDIRLYHPTLSLEELLRIGEAMPDPTWPSN